MICETAMRTEDLIGLLSDGIDPVKPRTVARFLATGLAAGIAVSVVAMLTTLGLRHDLSHAVQGAAFWTKFCYTLTIAAFGLWVVERSGRPGCDPVGPSLFLAIPVIAIFAIAGVQLLRPGADMHALIMGSSARVCAVLIFALSIPLLGGIFWALRSLAPTRLVQAGAAAGLLSGSTAATIYALHCPETAAPFVALWYSAGILLSTLVGALLGRWALRW
jgi:hypothetical protein